MKVKILQSISCLIHKQIQSYQIGKEYEIDNDTAFDLCKHGIAERLDGGKKIAIKPRRPLQKPKKAKSKTGNVMGKGII